MGRLYNSVAELEQHRNRMRDHGERAKLPGYPEYASAAIRDMPNIAELAAMTGAPILSDAGDVALAADAYRKGGLIGNI